MALARTTRQGQVVADVTPATKKPVKSSKLSTASTASVEVKYGGVSVLVSQPTLNQLKTNVKRSTRVMSGLEQRIAQPGVKLTAQKGVPLYSVDARDPSIMVRDLNGTKEKGHLVNGTFRPIKAVKRSAAA